MRARYAKWAEGFFSNVALKGSVEWMVSCPFHGGRDSLQFNIDTGKWVCFGCRRGGDIGALTDEDLPDYTPTMASLRKTLNRLQQNAPDTITFPLAWLAQYAMPHDYWDDRGYTSETQREWRLGYDLDSDRVTIPLLTWDGKGCHGVIKRTLASDDFPKYLYPTGFKRARYLFGEHRVPLNDTVFVVEGSLDVVDFHDAGAYAVAVLGSRMSEAQAERLKRLCPEKVVLAFDNDHAGWEGTRTCRELLKGLPIQTLDWPEHVKDAGGMSLPDRTELVKTYL